MPNLENAFKTVCELVKDFKENESRYLSPQYQEAEVRRDYIDKFFEALGWDVYHRTQKNPYEQEVKVEKGVSVGKAQKRADYAFYIAPEFRQPKFFAEAKKPSRSLKNADDYFQTIRYGWNANTPVAVLTDFEEFHILDCRYKPKLNTVLENPNHKRYSYNDYSDHEKFKEIYYLFSRDDVAKNSLEKYSESFPKGKARGKTAFKSTIQAIDDDFLEYIDDVRETLAKAFKKNDSRLSSEELTEATQRTIDRIVFIRFLEDKLIEPEYYISEFGRKGNAWTEFISVCRKLDAKYNGIVFKKHFIDEQNFQGPEQSTFKKICDEMSYLNSPYDFNAIPVHILGSIYERFLGKVVNATAQRVKVEEKPEVRKAGGVYYTPKYIVDYIVENTVGKIIVGKTPAQISKLRFADIACGSGSFLIGVFETLLKYHSEYYQSHSEEAKKDGCINKDGQWILSIKQKQNILLNNIYGVDIDNQAVEVTQLSLALKMLEDETLANANEMQVLFHEKILPDLSKNIVCGNSLIGTDIIYEESTDGLFDRKRKITPEEERKLNPMDFEKRFPQVFCHSRESGKPENNGFDAIVGNPPWVFGGGTDISILEKDYFLNVLISAKGKVNLFAMFLEKACKLLKKMGFVSYIIPNTLLRVTSYKYIREYILKNNSIKEIIDLDTGVFKGVTMSTIIITLSTKTKTNEVLIKNGISGDAIIINQNQFIENNNIINIFSNTFDSTLTNKINSISILLGDLCKEMIFGVVISNNIEDVVFDEYAQDLKPFIEGRDIGRYMAPKRIRYLLYDKKLLHRARTPEVFEVSEKIMIQRITGGMRPLNATYDNNKFYNKESINNIILNDTVQYNVKFILGLINSKLFSWYYRINFTNESKLTVNLSKEYLSKLPIIKIDFENMNDTKHHTYIIQLVEQMLESKKLLQSAKTDKDKTYYENKCADLDNAIDSEVYKLYDLTPEEIKIVEGRQ
ncbi:MAG: TaqI-like C-terminal specificity domain-containing protein [Ignavibacteria bacterium]